MEKLDRSRRKVIGALMSLAAGILLLGKFLSPRVGRKKTLLTVEKTSIPIHGALVYRETRVAVIREAGEIYALSLVCTHLGCSVTVTPRELLCPCHGSVFDRRGNVVKGPADRPLVRYAVEDQGDRIVVAMS
jgi:cytochrome b6-f complex iron-sulfur subunit